MLGDRGTVHVDERSGVAWATAMNRARQQSFARARLAKNQNGWEPVRSWSLQQAADGISKRDDTAAAPKKLIEMQHGGDYSAADAPRSGGEPDWPRSCYAVRRLSHDQDSRAEQGALC